CVVLALQRLSTAERVTDELTASMTTDVDEGPKFPAIIAHDDDRDASHGRGQKAAGSGEIAEPADELPRPLEDPLVLKLKPFRLRVPRGGEGPPRLVSEPVWHAKILADRISRDPTERGQRERRLPEAVLA